MSTGNQGGTTLLELQQVGRTYRLGDVRLEALAALDLAIAPGEFVAFTGPSGSGKSTLCHLLGLLDLPTAGRIFLSGEDTATLDENRRAEIRNRRIGFVFQDFSLVPVLSALENVQLPLHLRRTPPADSRRRAAEALAAVGLAGSANQRPSQLSGGQQQRVALARGLVTEAEILIADEPTANLDSASAYAVLGLMRRLNTERGTTVLLATHDARLLEGVGRRVELRDGRLVADRRGGAP
ncbi:MAG: Lipoprotein-releasing system ATP-binding protein LolD [Lentisphaerae bacterium ADurb.BinA184]|nr:MAG: Lipoprotein-releasing system ATP-binding protein LolD [Lentisphaerae bacterium ADurb.BinA184]